MAKLKIEKQPKSVSVATEQAKGRPALTADRRGRQVKRGRVVAARLPQTATVLVEGRKTHPLYGKSYTQSRKYLVQDNLKVSLGDVVEIVQCRPISKNKRFEILRVVGWDIEAIVTEELKVEAAEAIAEVMPEEKVEEEVQIETEPVAKEKKKAKTKKEDKK